ncbi:MAG: isoprenylcysteine carboxylmethyltransferase family protein [Bacteroidales bacterium]|nr:isoprenylcysteine carboxylmethyltransferase family protein [Bacteroidales bacterium]
MNLTKKEQWINNILTFIQYSMLLAFALTGKWLATNLALLLIQILGLWLGLWSIMVMQKSKLHIAPRPKNNAILIQNGPYKLIRHPMYAAILLTFIPLILENPEPIRLILFLILFTNLIFKLHFEEGLLTRFFADYLSYKKTSYRLIPWIY